MSDTMIERMAVSIAKALASAFNTGYDGTDTYRDRDWETDMDEARELVRGMLHEMREPTRTVLVAGIDKAEDLVDYTRDSNEKWRIDDASDAPLPIWQAMIDAVLVEGA